MNGTLIVTPNAIMFDPSVHDPLVIEHGSEKYGMVAAMETIISAAIYRDLKTMKIKGQAYVTFYFKLREKLQTELFELVFWLLLVMFGNLGIPYRLYYSIPCRYTVVMLPLQSGEITCIS